MATRRDSPYVWVTWITRLIAGEDNCQWKSWFRAHHTYEKLPSSFDLARWASEHAAMVEEVATTLSDQGYQVRIEGQNSFALKGQTGITLGGKPDILAVRDDDSVVIDCKTGSQKHSDYMQVLTYMFAAPHSGPEFKGRSFRGEVRYRSGHVTRIKPSDLDDGFRQRLGDQVRLSGGETEPSRLPSFSECRYCDISSADCPDRVEEQPAKTDTDLF